MRKPLTATALVDDHAVQPVRRAYEYAGGRALSVGFHADNGERKVSAWLDANGALRLEHFRRRGGEWVSSGAIELDA